MKESILLALAFFGEPSKKIEDVDICEDGSVWLGLTMIIEPNNQR